MRTIVQITAGTFVTGVVVGALFVGGQGPGGGGERPVSVLPASASGSASRDQATSPDGDAPTSMEEAFGAAYLAAEPVPEDVRQSMIAALAPDSPVTVDENGMFVLPDGLPDGAVGMANHLGDVVGWRLGGLVPGSEEWGSPGAAITGWDGSTVGHDVVNLGFVPIAISGDPDRLAAFAECVRLYFETGPIEDLTADCRSLLIEGQYGSEARAIAREASGR